MIQKNKNALSKLQKKKPSKILKKKLILWAAGLLAPYLAVLILLLLVLLPGGGSGSSSQTVVKALDIPYEKLIQAEVQARQNNISFPLILYYWLQEMNEENEAQALAVAVAKAKAAVDMDREDRELYDLFVKAYGDLKAGPIPAGTETVYKKESEDKKSYEVTSTSWSPYTYTSSNDFGDARGYGDVTNHEGNDLMAAKGVPIVSITDGKVIKNGWNEYGGYRVGVESEHGTYFYYAHMVSPGIVPEGSRVVAGQIIGYVGDSGQGPEGSTGQFPPHLHLQIGLKVEDNEDYLWINPYNIVKYLDTKRVTFREEVIEN